MDLRLAAQPLSIFCPFALDIMYLRASELLLNFPSFLQFLFLPVLSNGFMCYVILTVADSAGI